MIQKDADGWAKKRAMGRRRYIYMYGVLFWGVLTGVLWALVMTFISDGPIIGRGLLGALSFALPAFMIGGYFWGAFMWNSSESAYNAHLKSKNEIL